MTASTGRLRWRHVFLNTPLMIGSAVLLALFVVVLFGPLFAPENPYLAGNRIIEYKDGQLFVPPFPPSPEIPLGTDQWGRDILSILLYGTRNTLVACTFITMARLTLGLILGAIAGWNSGRLVDRIVMGAVELTTALPMLIIGMILIFALDIRRGITVFIVALCFVGWGEIAQYIRSEFMVLKGRPFIEGARVIGLHGAGIAVRHVLPRVQCTHCERPAGPGGPGPAGDGRGAHDPGRVGVRGCLHRRGDSPGERGRERDHTGHP